MGPGGRNQVPNRAVMGELAEGGSFGTLIGRRVRTRWPDDNNFYEAVISDYNPNDVFTTLEYLVICLTLICGENVYLNSSIFRDGIIWSMTWGLQMKLGNGLNCQRYI